LLASSVLLCTEPARVGRALEPSATCPARSGAALVDGDIVFRAGRDALARLVLNQRQRSRYSHVGMIVRFGSDTYVVHALPEEGSDSGGVQLTRLDDFIACAQVSAVGYFRLDRLSAPQRRSLRAFLLARLGTPFDYRFEYTDDGAFYCTELVLEALKSVGADLAPSLVKVVVFGVDEPVIPPDSLRESADLRELSP
jgi:uncharacterized protein YycO